MTRTLVLSTALLLSTSTGPLTAKAGTPVKDLSRPSKGGPTCNELDPERIECDSVTTRTLLATDCLLIDDTVFDSYVFEGREGDRVQIDLASDDFDTVVYLNAPDGALFAIDSGPGNDSRIVTTLDADGSWGIGVNNLEEVTGDPGAYTLSLTCREVSCAPSATAACLNKGRFRVEVEWTDFEGVSGPGRRVSLPVAADDSDLFYFFSADNWELLIKVLDGCAINDRYWVFGAATTTVEYTVRVTDTRTDEVRTFFNPLGVASSAITDTDAFATCP